MTAMWPLSRIPQFSADGAPLVGAQAFFYDASTTTPQTTYSDSGLSQVSPVNGSGAVVADANGRFPAVFLSPTPGTYRQRVLDADDVVLFDDDGISVPQDADFVPPEAGDTDPTLLWATGDIKVRHGTGVVSGFVRGNGRTIGSASSGASERANADTSALFQYLWAADSTLTVSSGRGGTAAGDFAANKTIALPDYRSRTLAGLADMGNTALTILSGNVVDNSETVSTLGATLGVGSVTLTAAQIAAHAHPATFAGSAMAAHSHSIHSRDDSGQPSGSTVSDNNSSGLANGVTTDAASAGTPAGTVTVSNNTGGDGAHPNAQPTALVTIYVKL